MIFAPGLGTGTRRHACPGEAQLGEAIQGVPAVLPAMTNTALLAAWDSVLEAAEDAERQEIAREDTARICLMCGGIDEGCTCTPGPLTWRDR